MPNFIQIAKQNEKLKKSFIYVKYCLFTAPIVSKLTIIQYVLVYITFTETYPKLT